MKIDKLHGALSPVAANSIGMAEIPLGPTLHTTKIECLTSAGAHLTVAQMKSEIEYITIKAGSREIVNQISATDLLELEAYWGLTNKDGYINIYHALPFLEQRFRGSDAQDGEVTAIGTKDSKQIVVYVKVASGATNVSKINVRGKVTEDGRKFGSFVTYKKESRSHTTTGNEQVDKLPKGISDRAHLLWKLSAATLDQLNLKVNGRDLLEDKKIEEIQMENVNSGRVAVSGKLHIDFTLGNIFRFQDFLGQLGVTEQRLDVNWTTAPNSYEILMLQLEDISKQTA
jgi:hypothetical protein